MIEYRRHFGGGGHSGGPDRPRRIRAHAVPHRTFRPGGLRSSDVTVVAIGIGLVVGLIVRFALHLG